MSTCSTTCRRLVLPLISKRWARLLQGPSAAWKELTVNITTDLEAPRQLDSPEDLGEAAMRGDRATYCKPNTAAVFSWFRRRTVRALYLQTNLRGRLQGTLTVAILGAQLNSLTVLDIHAHGCGLGNADVPLLSGCSKLESLSIKLGETDWSDNSLALMQTASLLPALTKLVMGGEAGVWPLEHLGGMPTCATLAALQSSSLKHLSVCFPHSDVETLQLGSLPELASCTLDWWWLESVACAGCSYATARQVTVGGACFAGTPKLASLQMLGCDQHLVLEDSCLDACSSLTRLELSGWEPYDMPQQIAGASRSLKELEMPDVPHVEAAEVAELLLRMSKLERLMCGENSDYDSGPGYLDSVDCLAPLKRAFAAKYGRQLQLIDVDLLRCLETAYPSVPGSCAMDVNLDGSCC